MRERDSNSPKKIRIKNHKGWYYEFSCKVCGEIKHTKNLYQKTCSRDCANLLRGDYARRRLTKPLILRAKGWEALKEVDSILFCILKKKLVTFTTKELQQYEKYLSEKYQK